MSFSKAKIHRFNDVKECTPSPANYNVTIQDKVKLGIISQSGMDSSRRHTSCSESETGSVNSTPCFQTPSVPKKKKFFGLAATFKKKTPTITYSDAEELREKIVECSNKDATIRELTEQMEELREKVNLLERERSELLSEKEQYVQKFSLLKQEQDDVNFKHLELHVYIGEIAIEMGILKQQFETLKTDTCLELKNLSQYLEKFGSLHHQVVAEKEVELLKEEDHIRKIQEEVEELKTRLRKDAEEARTCLEESEARLRQVEENFKETSLLTEIQMREKLESVESGWRLKLEEQQRESEAILKECQAISEYNIIQSEIEKNQFKNLLTEKEAMYDEVLAKHQSLEKEHGKIVEELGAIKTEKHAYELSITTFNDTIEVLKKRLINSDRDVEQLKEELSSCEEKILSYEKKLTDMSAQLNEVQTAKEDLEMQYESTSKIMQNQVKTVEKSLLDKVNVFQQKLLKDKELLDQVLPQYHEQQAVITVAQNSIAQSAALIDNLEKRLEEMEQELTAVRKMLSDETSEADLMRRKYIETSGKYDELLQQFEQVSQELQRVREKNEELQKLIGPYQEQLEAYDQELNIIKSQKECIEGEVASLQVKYAEILGHQNHQQKIKHLRNLNVKSSELFQKNLELEAKNFKLTKTVEKLRKEMEEVKKGGGRPKITMEDKENLGSPKCSKGVQSPGPLKDKNHFSHSFVGL